MEARAVWKEILSYARNNLKEAYTFISDIVFVC